MLEASLAAFRSAGSDVTIYPGSRIIRPEAIRLGSHIIIDDFVFIGPHARLIIGNHVHISSHASITGGGECIVCDFCAISSGVRVLTGTDDFGGSGLTNSTIPPPFRSVVRKRTVILPHAMLGVNTVILPGIVIGEGVSVGAGSVVTQDLEPWGIYVGSPARRIRERPSAQILESQRALFRQEGMPDPRFLAADALDEW